MPKRQLPELFPERPIRSDFGRAQTGIPYAVRRVITLCVLMLVIGGSVWFYRHERPSTPGVIPTIKSEGTYKQRPDQPGGMDIPHQDVEVYKELDGSNTGKLDEVDHLMPMPETPQPVPSAIGASVSGVNIPAIKTDAMESLIAPTTPQSETVKIETTVTPSAPMEAAPKPLVVDVTPPVVSPPPVVAAAVTAAPVAVPAVPTPSLQPKLEAVTMPKQPMQSVSNKPDGGAETAVQLASIPDEDAAQQALQKLQGRYANILGDLSLRLVRADLGAKGVYYRIQSQPVSAQRASQICSAIKSSNAGCILVRH